MRSFWRGRRHRRLVPFAPYVMNQRQGEIAQQVDRRHQFFFASAFAQQRKVVLERDKGCDQPENRADRSAQQRCDRVEQQPAELHHHRPALLCIRDALARSQQEQRVDPGLEHPGVQRVRPGWRGDTGAGLDLLQDRLRQRKVGAQQWGQL
ncbi:hypothetical protein D3C71_1496930 [compost metagenome]